MHLMAHLSVTCDSIFLCLMFEFKHYAKEVQSCNTKKLAIWYRKMYHVINLKWTHCVTIITLKAAINFGLSQLTGKSSY